MVNYLELSTITYDIVAKNRLWKIENNSLW
jgi:hypothetical protein